MRDSDIRAEQETIVRWDRTDDPVTVCICYPPEWKKLDKAGFMAIRVDSDSKGRTRSKTYEIDRAKITLKISKNSPNRRDPRLSIVTGPKKR